MLALLLGAVLGRWVAIGPSGQYANVVAADPVTPGRVYAGTGSGLFMSEDAGATWTLAGSRPTCGSVRAIALDAAATEIVYAGTDTSIDCVAPGGDGLFRSPNAARDWTVLETGHPIRLLKTVATVPGRLYVTSVQSCVRIHGFFVDCTSRLLRSDDFGESFSAADSGLPGSSANFLDVDEENPHRLFATAGGVFRSDDGGASWRPLAAPAGISGTAEFGAIGADPRNGDVVLLSTSDGNFRSVDGGGHWMPTSPTMLPPITQFLFDRDRPGVVYAVVNGGDVFRSLDGGSSWTPFDAGLENVAIVFGLSEGAPDGRRGRVLYAATGRGAFAIDLGNPILPALPAIPSPVDGRGR
jgi:photosystem II stability/assembly factor-like uncharacterized protein